MCGGIAMDSKEKKMGKFDKWTVEDALRDIERAEAHKQDEELMEQVAILATKKVKAISSIADLKEIRKKKKMEEAEA